jgi:hypothetical protein
MADAARRITLRSRIWQRGSGNESHFGRDVLEYFLYSAVLLSRLTLHLRGKLLLDGHRKYPVWCFSTLVPFANCTRCVPRAFKGLIHTPAATRLGS